MQAGKATSEYAPGPRADDRSDTGYDARWSSTDRAVFAFILLLAFSRTAAIILSPLELGVDEAQYWLWGTGFDFGYYTKPPLTSWIIGLSHSLFGHHVWAVRLPAPWLHLATALVLWRTAGWMGGPAGATAGRWAACLWMTLPAVGLGSFVISTDTPLLLAWSVGLMALIGVMTGHLRVNRSMALAGAAFGAGMLSKYAAIYAALGIVLFVIIDRSWHRQHHVTPFGLILFAAGLLVVASPNLMWNLANDFKTVRHLGDNANLDQQSYSLGNSLTFLGAQFATAGPLVFVLMFGILRLKRGAAMHGLLLCFGLPPLLIIMLQAFLSEANANWAIVAMPALTLWLAGWLASRAPRRRQKIGLAALGVNAGLTAGLILVTGAGSFGPLTPQSDPLRRLRGWDILASDTAKALARHDAKTVVADRRATAALLTWHFHDSDIDILIHDADGVPSNHYEQNRAWTAAPGRRLIALDGQMVPPSMKGVVWQEAAADASLSDVTISTRRNRRLHFHYGVEAR